MFKKNLVPVWIGIIFVASVFFIGAAPEGCAPAPVPKTGQTATYSAGDDGYYQMGIAWPDPRFTDNLDGTVTDNLTGLRWTKNANCDGQKSWSGALGYCNELADETCGLSDGSYAGVWRLPHVRELQSLVDYGNWDPALTTSHPFADVQLTYPVGYWSSTTTASSWPPILDFAWYVEFIIGEVKGFEKINPGH